MCIFHLNCIFQVLYTCILHVLYTCVFHVFYTGAFHLTCIFHVIYACTYHFLDTCIFQGIGKVGKVADRILIYKTRGDDGLPQLEIVKAKDIRERETTGKKLSDLPRKVIKYND